MITSLEQEEEAWGSFEIGDGDAQLSVMKFRGSVRCGDSRQDNL